MTSFLFLPFLLIISRYLFSSPKFSSSPNPNPIESPRISISEDSVDASSSSDVFFAFVIGFSTEFFSSLLLTFTEIIKPDINTIVNAIEINRISGQIIFLTSLFSLIIDLILYLLKINKEACNS